MPIMDGVESSKYIRNNINSNINIVAVTSYSLYDISDSSVFDDILNKPMNYKQTEDLFVSRFIDFSNENASPCFCFKSVDQSLIQTVFYYFNLINAKILLS
jgi:CheY-like chemotaxis protein